MICFHLFCGNNRDAHSSQCCLPLLLYVWVELGFLVTVGLTHYAHVMCQI